MKMKRQWTISALSAICATAIVCGTLQVHAAAVAQSSRLQFHTVSGVQTTSTASKKLPRTTTITYMAEGMKQSVKANLFVSSQGYTMYALQGFKASAEEPGKDIVLFQRNSKSFMRIEKLPAGVSLVSVRKNVIASLKAVGKVSGVSTKSYSDPFFQGASFIYHAHADAVDQTAMVIKIKGDYYRILINTPKETESISPYLAMIKTIAPVQNNPLQSGNTGIVAGALVTSIVNQGTDQDGNLNFVIQVKNQTEREQQLTFNTGQKYDYVLSRDGIVVGQYSRGKMFSQHVEFVTLKQGDELNFPIQLSGLGVGHYHLEAWVTYAGWAESAHSKASVDFSIVQ